MALHEKPDPYLVLGVSSTATQAEIAHAYRTRLRTHHPDTRHSRASRTADDDLREVVAAYALLRDPVRRAEYDRATNFTVTPPPHRRQARTPVDRRAGGPIQIPVTVRTPDTAVSGVPSPPLRVGPVRRHR